MKNRSTVPRMGDKIVLTKDTTPNLLAGTEVKFMTEWYNFYGTWWRVETTDGRKHDVPPHCFEEVKNEV